MPSIAEVIQQRSFEDPRQQVLINLLYSAAFARTGSTSALKPFSLTWQQFNLLRILRGQRGKPASMRTLSERMLDPQSNASRLVDKLEEKQYVSRVTCPNDRRQVRVSLTALGDGVLAQASTAITAFYSDIGGDLSEQELLLLSDLLDRFRNSKSSKTCS